MSKLARTITAVEAATAITQNSYIKEMEASHIAKIPIQDRGKARFNAIIEAAEALVLEIGIDSISSHKIAEKANISSASVYQYFPSMGAMFSVMAEKHIIRIFHTVPEAIDKIEVRTWQDLASVIIDCSYDFYTHNKISEMLFLSVYHSSGVREYTASRFTRLGYWCQNYFALLYKKADLEDLPEKLALCLDITKTIYIRSLSLHGEITASYKDEARIVVMSYLGDYFSQFEAPAK